MSEDGGGGYDGKIAGLYDLEETLGKGHYAVVKLARHVFTGEKVAVKVIDKMRLDEPSKAHLFQEVRCMKLVQHPNVVRLYEVIDTQTKLYLILELADGGDLYDYIMKHEEGLSEEAARMYFRQIVHAISYCHKLHVVHRDLKPENVVFFEKLQMVKLTDFGFSNKFCPGQKLETSCGSLAYSAPEILLGDSYDAPAVDVWSLGVILYMLVVGDAPFQEANDSETLTRIMDCRYTIPDHVSKPCKDLIASMLIRDPGKRSCLEDIACDPWLNQGADLDVSKVLPLVSRQHLTEDEHAYIIQKMVSGNIASVEEVLEALDRNEYNHITATYFLLAERKLRAHRLHQADLVRKCSPERENAYRDENSVSQTKSIKVPPISKDDMSTALHTVKVQDGRLVSNRLRTFSILEEEEEENDMEELDDEIDERPLILDSSKDADSVDRGQRSRSGSRSGSRSNSRRGSRASSTSSLKDKCLRDMKLDLSLLHRLECARRGSTGSHQGSLQSSAATSPCTEDVPVPEPPFPPLSNIGICRGRTRSAGTSPATTPPNSLQSVSNVSALSHNSTSASSVLSPPKITPQSSVSSSSPNSQASSPSSPIPSSPKNQANVLGFKFKTLPSPNRRLHSVRSSPQLILNEIFEEIESDAECGGSTSMSTLRSVFSSDLSSPGTLRRHRLVRSRTASCSSSDASDDDMEGRRRWNRSFSHQASKSFQESELDELKENLFAESIEGQDFLRSENNSHSTLTAFSSHSSPSKGEISPDIPMLTFSPPPMYDYTLTAPPSSRSTRPLSNTSRDGCLTSDALSSENVLDVDTTLRESRSLNCILKATEEDVPLLSHTSELSSSFGEMQDIVTVSSDNITTIYIDDDSRFKVQSVIGAESKLKDQNTVVIHVNDKTSINGKGKSYGDTNVVKASDVVLGLVDTCTFSSPTSHLSKVITSQSAIPSVRPVSEIQLLKSHQGSCLSKSVSHIDSLNDLSKGRRVLRPSATNGSLAAGRRNYFLMDINQNAGSRKNRSEKASVLAFHGSSKCCTLS